MAFFSRDDDGAKRKGGKVVVTGKRVNGRWVMESSLPPKARRDRNADVIVERENRRGRTLH